MKTGLALNCTIPPLTKWDRKQYYYPDLPKGYQISQYDLPFSAEGWLEITTDSQTRRIGIIRAHLEEDAGKNLHDETGRGGDSLIDLNRAGTPLLEIVSKPDLRSGAEAHAYLDELKLLLTYLEVSDCNMQEGSLRCDANVNLHVQTDDGLTVATPIVEIKNLNSFRGVESAIEYEARRQVEEWERTGHKLGDVPKETRGWNAERGVTFGQRGKEEASDYRYFPDPDLVPVTISEDWKRQIREQFGEFPAAKRRRFETEHQLSHYDASVIVAQGQSFADYFERVAAICGDAKQAANWMTQDVLREMKERKTPIDEFPIRLRCSGFDPVENRSAANHDQQRTDRVQRNHGGGSRGKRDGHCRPNHRGEIARHHLGPGRAGAGHRCRSGGKREDCRRRQSGQTAGDRRPHRPGDAAGQGGRPAGRPRNAGRQDRVALLDADWRVPTGRGFGPPVFAILRVALDAVLNSPVNFPAFREFLGVFWALKKGQKNKSLEARFFWKTPSGPHLDACL